MDALVIDENNEWAHLLQGTLYSHGYAAVERASSWEEATFFLSSPKKWDLIISVLNLPVRRQDNATISSEKTWLTKLRQNLKHERMCPVVFIQESNNQDDYHEIEQKFPCTILKKINYTEANLKKSIQIANKRFSEADWLQAPFSLVYHNTILKDYIFIEDNVGHLHMVDCDDLFYLKSYNKHVYVFHGEKSPYVVRKPIIKIINDLPKSKFFSPHRGFLVNITKIAYIDKKQRIIALKNGTQIPMSHGVRNAMMELLKIW